MPCILPMELHLILSLMYIRDSIVLREVRIRMVRFQFLGSMQVYVYA